VVLCTVSAVGWLVSHWYWHASGSTGAESLSECIKQLLNTVSKRALFRLSHPSFLCHISRSTLI
jgi:hypothetical protein